jgi:hypothetical protein
MKERPRKTLQYKMNLSTTIRWHGVHFFLLLTTFLLRIADARPPPPQANDVFGTVFGCASGLIEMDDNGDGMVKRNEYLDFVNLIAAFLCIPPRPALDLELQTVFFSIACLCQEREGFSEDCCYGTDAAIFTDGAADAITRTEDQDAYLRAACLLTQAVLGPQQCTYAPRTIAPDAATLIISRSAPTEEDDGLSDAALWGIIFGIIALLLLCCLLLFCCCCKKKEEEEEETKEEVEAVPLEEDDLEKAEKSASVPPPPPVIPVPLIPAEDDVEETEKSASVPPVPTVIPTPPAPAPAPHPVIIPAPILRSVPPPKEEEVEEADEFKSRKKEEASGEEEEDGGRRFGGEGYVPTAGELQGIRLRHVEKEKPLEGEYEYPQREIEEHKLKREDSGQILDHYEPDGGVFIPERAKKAPVVMNLPKYERKKVVKESVDRRKARRQLGMGDGEVWDALAAHDERERNQSKLNCV